MKNLFMLMVFSILSHWSLFSQEPDFDFAQLQGKELLIQIPPKNQLSEKKYIGFKEKLDTELERRLPLNFHFVTYEEWVGLEGGLDCRSPDHLGVYKDRKQYQFIISIMYDIGEYFLFSIRDRRLENCPEVYTFRKNRLRVVTDTRPYGVQQTVWSRQDESPMKIKEFAKVFAELLERDFAGDGSGLE